jgi:hypothetical protein
MIELFMLYIKPVGFILLAEIIHNRMMITTAEEVFVLTSHLTLACH